jgi:hypothetical protein
MKSAHFATSMLASALLAGSMAFAQAAGTVGGAAGAGTMTSPSAATAAPSAGARPSIGPSASPGLTTPNATGQTSTALPDPNRGLLPCKAGQHAGCDSQSPD